MQSKVTPTQQLWQLEYGAGQVGEVALALLNRYNDLKIWALDGPLGAGKTTLSKEVFKAMGVTDAVTSPTFSIIQEYQGFAENTLYHMDWYRLKDEDEAENAGVIYAIESGDFCLIEWPKWPELLKGHPYLNIKIDYKDDKRVLEAEIVYNP